MACFAAGWSDKKPLEWPTPRPNVDFPNVVVRPTRSFLPRASPMNGADLISALRRGLVATDKGGGFTVKRFLTNVATFLCSAAISASAQPAPALTPGHLSTNIVPTEYVITVTPDPQ